MSEQNEPTPAEMLMQMGFAHTTTRALSTALELELFAHLDHGARTVHEVARAARASERGVGMILDILAGFKLLVKKNDSYELTAPARQLLIPSSPDFLGGVLPECTAAPRGTI